jgi:hypothetical protein
VVGCLQSHVSWTGEYFSRRPLARSATPLMGPQRCIPLRGERTAGPAWTRPSEALENGPSSSCGEMDHQQDDADDEEHPRDLSRDSRDAAGAKHSSNQADDEKHERVIKHGHTSFSGKAEGVPLSISYMDQWFVGEPVLSRVADCCNWQTSWISVDTEAGSAQPYNAVAERPARRTYDSWSDSLPSVACRLYLSRVR